MTPQEATPNGLASVGVEIPNQSDERRNRTMTKLTAVNAAAAQECRALLDENGLDASDAADRTGLSGDRIRELIAGRADWTLEDVATIGEVVAPDATQRILRASLQVTQ